MLRTFLCIALILGLLAVRPPITAAAADPIFDLHGRFFSPAGWGSTSTSITSPGPLIQVNVGVSVTLNLYSDDSLTHTFFVDYNGNGVPDSGEPLSPSFSSPSTPQVFTFTASVTGSFSYWCSIHKGPMFGPWTTLGGPPPNTPPSVSFSSPSGGSRWSGNSQHQVTWTMTDAQDPAANLRVWLNLTIGSMTTGLVNNQLGATAYTWSIPFANATASLHLDVLDTGGAVGSNSATLTIDSTLPQVQPSGIAYASQAVTVTFSEAMASSTSDRDIAVLNLNTSAWAPGTVAWSNGNTIATFRPVSVLEPGNAFRVYVNGTLRDSSDPGNPLAQPVTYEFMVPRTNPPTNPQGFDAAPFILPAAVAAILVASALAVLSIRRRKRGK